MDLNLVTLQLTLSLETLAKLTQLLGSALRFEAALRALVCSNMTGSVQAALKTGSAVLRCSVAASFPLT